MAFFTTKVELLRTSNLCRQNPELLRAFANRQDLSVLDEYARKKLTDRNDDFLTIQIRGEQGSGKSGLAQMLANRWSLFSANPIKFSSDRVALHYDEFMELVGGSIRGEWSILDEQTKLFGAGSHRLAADIVNMIETLRKHGSSMVLVSPTEKIVDVYDVHLDLLVIGQDAEYVLFAWRSRTEDYLGVISARLNWNDEIWQAYELKKASYLEDAKRLQFRKTDYEKLAAKVSNHPDAVYARKRSDWLLILEKTYPNLTGEEKKLVIAQILLDKNK